MERTPRLFGLLGCLQPCPGAASSGSSTADILKLADEFDVSAEAMLRRVASTGYSAINRAIILARKAGPTDAEVGVPPLT